MPITWRPSCVTRPATARHSDTGHHQRRAHPELIAEARLTYHASWVRDVRRCPILVPQAAYGVHAVLLSLMTLRSTPPYGGRLFCEHVQSHI